MFFTEADRQCCLQHGWRRDDDELLAMIRLHPQGPPGRKQEICVGARFAVRTPAAGETNRPTQKRQDKNTAQTILGCVLLFDLFHRLTEPSTGQYNLTS